MGHIMSVSVLFVEIRKKKKKHTQTLAQMLVFLLLLLLKLKSDKTIWNPYVTCSNVIWGICAVYVMNVYRPCNILILAPLHSRWIHITQLRAIRTNIHCVYRSNLSIRYLFVLIFSDRRIVHDATVHCFMQGMIWCIHDFLGVKSHRRAVNWNFCSETAQSSECWLRYTYIIDRDIEIWCKLFHNFNTATKCITYYLLL